MKRVLLALFFLALLSLPLSAYGAYEDQYVLSPSIHQGSYAVYKVYGHPTLEEFRITVISTAKTSALLEVSFTDYTRSVTTLIQNISVVRSSYTVPPDPVQNPTSGIYVGIPEDFASTDIISPSNYFALERPIIATNLAVSDFLNFDDRNAGIPIAVTRIGGDIFNYSFRKILVSESPANQSPPYSYTWDGATGLLMKYSTADQQPFKVTLVATNFWSSPASQLLSSPLALPELVFGIFFTWWQVWALLLGGMALKLFIFPWIRNVLKERGALKANPALLRTLDEVEKQKGVIKTVVHKE